MKNLIVYLIVSAFIVSCSSKNEYEPVNENASLPENFDFNAMNLQVVTSSINHKKQTMMTLYGNASAINELKGTPAKNEDKERVLALITWSRKDDPYWYGAKIPDHLLSVEMIRTNRPLSDSSGIAYHRYEGKGLKKIITEDNGRISKILHMKPSVMP